MRKGEQVAMVERLRELRGANPGERIRDSVVRRIADPVKPRTVAGNLRINSVLLLLASLAVMAAGTFIFFSLVAQ